MSEQIEKSQLPGSGETDCRYLHFYDPVILQDSDSFHTSAADAGFKVWGGGEDKVKGFEFLAS